MLTLARADSGQQKVRVEEIYLNELVDECCGAAQTLAGRAGVHLNWKQPDDIPFRGDSELLRRMTLNLLDNAIHYTPAGGNVEARLAASSRTVQLTVVDTGVGIPPELQPRVFDRFYRVIGKPGTQNGGSGLGLSIVKVAVEAHRGTIELVSAPGKGSTFIVTLPLP
jgi:signal transduction histidine kinase